MSIADYIIMGVIFAAAAGAFVYLLRKKAKGGCCGCCGNCAGCAGNVYQKSEKEGYGK